MLLLEKGTKFSILADIFKTKDLVILLVCFVSNTYIYVEKMFVFQSITESGNLCQVKHAQGSMSLTPEPLFSYFIKQRLMWYDELALLVWLHITSGMSHFSVKGG